MALLIVVVTVVEAFVLMVAPGEHRDSSHHTRSPLYFDGISSICGRVWDLKWI